MSTNICNSVCKVAGDDEWCNTEMQTHEVRYVWTIDNFDFHEASGSILQSPTFSADTNREVKWYLDLKTNGETDAKDTVSLYISRSKKYSTDDTNKKIFAKFVLSVLDRSQREINDKGSIEAAKVYEFSFTHRPASAKSLHSWGYSKFKKKNVNFRTNLLSDKKLTVICRLKFSSVENAFSNAIHHCKATTIYPEAPACNIVENLETLFENREFADIVLCVKEKEYPAHKIILAARSSVFSAMFKHNLKENETNRIEIEDMNGEVVAEMLRYIYTGKCGNCEKLADGLLAAADKYDLDRLKKICAEELFKTLSVDNAANILVLADLHRVRELKSEVIEFIVARFAEVVDSTAWQDILASHTELVNEVCKTLAVGPTVSNKRTKFYSCRRIFKHLKKQIF